MEESTPDSGVPSDDTIVIHGEELRQNLMTSSTPYDSLVQVEGWGTFAKAIRALGWIQVS